MTPKAANLVDPPTKADWIRHRERGSIALLRIMAFVSLHLGRTLSRIPLYGIAIYFFLFAPSARRHSRRYLRLALGRHPSARDRFRQILSFATTIHDRVYLIDGQFEKFHITLEGESLILAQSDSGRGALLMGAHSLMGCALHHRGEMLAAHQHLEAGSKLHDPAKHSQYVQFYRIFDPGTIARSEDIRTLWPQLENRSQSAL